MRLEYFEMIDEVAALDVDAGTIRCLAHVPAASPVFEGHFPGHPLMPGVLLIETMAQASGYLVLARDRYANMPFLASVNSAKMRRFVTPGETLEVTAEVAHSGSGYVVTKTRITAGTRRCCEAEILLRQVPFPNEELRGAMMARVRGLHVAVETA